MLCCNATFKLVPCELSLSVCSLPRLLRLSISIRSSLCPDCTSLWILHHIFTWFGLLLILSPDFLIELIDFFICRNYSLFLSFFFFFCKTFSSPPVFFPHCHHCHSFFWYLFYLCIPFPLCTYSSILLFLLSRVWIESPCLFLSSLKSFAIFFLGSCWNSSLGFHLISIALNSVVERLGSYGGREESQAPGGWSWLPSRLWCFFFFFCHGLCICGFGYLFRLYL